MIRRSNMSFLGIDLGNWSCHVIHDKVCPVSGINVKTKVSQIKCLLGRKFSDPELQLELDYVPFRVIEGPDGYPLVHGRCNGEDRAFTPVEILAMLFSTPEFLGRLECSDSSPSTCIGIPIYFTDQQKKDVLEAASIAGFPGSFCLDETAAMLGAPLGGLVDLPATAVYVDIGHASMQIRFEDLDNDCYDSIVYQGYARLLGGREFDKVLFNHFASKIRKEYNIDVSQNSSACVRLSEACESLKIHLSKNNEASFYLEKLSGSIDVKGSITRKNFEFLSDSILKKIEVALKKALSESRSSSIYFIEAIGKGCSIPAIVDILEETFERMVTILSYNEEVARGCAKQAAEKDYIMGPDRKINDLTTGRQTNSELVSSKDSEKFLWRRAMDKGGHLLTFLNDFLEQNMHRIGRSEKTTEESYWLSLSGVRNFVEYSYSELQVATKDFHESFKLGEGGFGIVYKGILQKSSSTVAIKILKEGSSQGSKEFNQEVEILSKVCHPNLVKLLGTCVETRALIYEYLPNGSLEDRLRCKNNTSPLSWQERVRIAFEICSALSFLHCSEPHGIVHGDLKPDNILLDENNTSKICDFGLCRQLNWTASASIPYHWTDCPKGTLAYMDPEYFSTGKITPQFDIYSFGIILLRLVTCKDPRGIRNLVEEVQRKGTLKALIDASAGPWPFKEAKKMISLGLRCSDPIRKNRPDLSTKVSREIKSMLQVDSASAWSTWAPSLFHR